MNICTITILEHVNGRIATSISVVGPRCNPAEGKVNKHRGIYLSSMHKGFFTTTKICKKKSMQVESTALAGQKETIYHEEKKRAGTDLEFSFCIFFLF